jgi:hypothetical protein
MEEEGRIVEVQSVHDALIETTSPALGENRQLYATVAYYYPQYTLKQVAKLPYRDVYLLLKTANRIEAERMYNLTQIASAPHSKKGKGVKDLLDHFRKILKG